MNLQCMDLLGEILRLFIKSSISKAKITRSIRLQDELTNKSLVQTQLAHILNLVKEYFSPCTFRQLYGKSYQNHTPIMDVGWTRHSGSYRKTGNDYVSDISVCFVRKTYMFKLEIPIYWWHLQFYSMFQSLLRCFLSGRLSAVVCL
jgi:hypothetical protein